MRVLTVRAGSTVLGTALAAGVLAALTLPGTAGASLPAAQVDAGVLVAPATTGGAVLGPAVAYVRDPDGTVRRIR